MKITFTLPSLFPEILQATIQTLYQNLPSNAGFEYEIVIVSPFQVTGPYIKWVPEDKPRGNSFAHNQAYLHSTGDVIIALSDDFFFQEPFLESAIAQLVEGEKSYFPYACGLTSNLVGTVFGIYYPYFPVISRRSIEAVGGFYSPEFIAHFADCDLALRIWSSGGKCEIAMDSHIYGLERKQQVELPESQHRSLAKVQDMETFLKKWMPLYGVGWKGDDLRDFNLDILPLMLPSLVRNKTIYVNTPDFHAAVMRVYRLVEYESHKTW